MRNLPEQEKSICSAGIFRDVVLSEEKKKGNEQINNVGNKKDAKRNQE